MEDWIGELPRLEKLTWEVSRKISNQITKCKFLTECHLYHIEKARIPDLSKQKFLEVLSLQNIKDKNEYIPKWIGSCKSLKELVIEYGNIKYLRDVINQIKNNRLNKFNKDDIRPQYRPYFKFKNNNKNKLQVLLIVLLHQHYYTLFHL